MVFGETELTVARGDTLLAISSFFEMHPKKMPKVCAAMAKSNTMRTKIKNLSNFGLSPMMG